MSCSPFDLRDYFLEELPENDRRQVEGHVKTCPLCREELDALRITGAALRSLPEEEIPQRIAFVSDKIFEPSPARRWWSAFWNSGARLGFASAAMLSIAILVSALTRPAPAPVEVVTPPVTQAEVDRRIAEAVTKAVADSEARQAKKTDELISAVEKRNEIDRQALILAFDKTYEYMQKRLNRYVIAANDYGAPR
jgi:anti-sigma factor RsiW